MPDRLAPRIAIIGAGPAGLTLAALLHNRCVPCTIFELRPQPSAADLASVSGMLDLHTESGLAALHACDLYDAFLPLTQECGEAMRVLDKDGVLTYSDEGNLEFRPEISRHALLKLLLSAVPADAVKWGHKLRSATQQENSPVLLDFGDQGTHEVDLVVGADGAWSKIRTGLLPDAEIPHYTGVQNLTVTIEQISTRYPHLAALVGNGGMMALGTGNIIASHRGAHDSVRLYVGVCVDDEHFAASPRFANKTAKAVGEAYLADDRLFGRWGEKMKDMLQTACKEEIERDPTAKADIRPLYELPVGHSWKHRAGVTLIGDAAHLMTPWAGEGANIAMWDALDLAKVIGDAWDALHGDEASSWPEQLEPRLRAFEKMMTERAAVRAGESSKNGQLILQEDAATLMADLFKSFGPPPE